MWLYKVILWITSLFIATNSATLTELEWQLCDKNGENALGFECTELNVPLDYTNITDGEDHTLELIRLPAVDQPSKGSVIINLGGPGFGGHFGLADQGLILRRYELLLPIVLRDANVHLQSYW